MGKRAITKRLSTTSQSASRSIDTKARKRIEELYELTDEIINAYNEINETYVHQIYRKYQKLKEVNKKLQEKLKQHHCTDCQCPARPDGDKQQQEEEKGEEVKKDESDSSMDEIENEEETAADSHNKATDSALPSSSTTNSVVTRSKKKNPFIISDIEDTQNFDDEDSRFIRDMAELIDDDDDDDDDDDEDISTMDTNQNAPKEATNDNESEEEEEEEEEEGENEVDKTTDEDNGMARLPLALQNVIKKKANKNKNAKTYLLQIARYPVLCEFLRDKSRTSFDQRPTENQVRPLISNHLSKYLSNDSKIRMRVRDELREIHRSYLRTFMCDPHGGSKTGHKTKQLTFKKSPM